MRRFAHLAASSLGTLLLLVGAVAGVLNHEVLDADRFAGHVDAVRTDSDVARQLGALLTDRLLEEQPDLIVLRPVIESTATGVVASDSLGTVVRASVAPLYDALVLGDGDPVVLRLADVAAVVVAAVSALAPDATISVPADLDVRLSAFGAGERSADLVGVVHLVSLLAWLAPLLGLLLLGGVGAVTAADRRLAGALAWIGRGGLVAGGLLAAGLVIVGALVRRGDPDTLSGAIRRATWDGLAGTFWITAVGVALIGAVLGLIGSPPGDRSRTLLRGLAMAVAGLALVIDPMRVATALLWLAGAVLLVAGVVTLVVTLTRTPAARAWVAAALGVLVAGLVIGAWPNGHDLAPARAEVDRSGCNGHVELCASRYDEVAYPATHNSMSAASEGWLFPEQPDGIVDQLDAGIRVLLIDSWYGRETNRPGVITTAGEGRERAVDQANEAFGAAAVQSALRVQAALGLTPRGPVGEYLCHAMCELGSTPWLDSLRSVRAWMDDHPNEVVTLFVQDEVSPADTAALIERAGLLPDVYTPVSGSGWPTLGQMIESGKRLVVLMENHGGGTTYPWLLQGFDWVQDTPYLFRDPADLEKPSSCDRNRGGADAPLLLINHWVTDKTAEITNAERVNSRAVLAPRLEECQQDREMLPNYVAVDFYDRGDLFDVVDELNGLG